MWLDVPADGRVSLDAITSGVNHADHDGGLFAINNAGHVFIGGGTFTGSVSNTQVGSSAGHSGGTFAINNAASGVIQSGGYYQILYSEAAVHGGAVLLSNAGRAELLSFNIEQSQASVGGAMYIHNSGAAATTIVGGRQNFNTAELAGGVYLNNAGGTVVTRDLTLENNTAGQGGGLRCFKAAARRRSTRPTSRTTERCRAEVVR